jgi:hypothetical protein
MNALTMRRTMALVLVLAVSFIAACTADGGPEDTSHLQPRGGGGANAGTGHDAGPAQPGDPDQPVSGGAGGGGQPQPPGGDGALQVRPGPGIVDPIPHAWDHISVAPDGRTITVYYWGGVEDCYGLARVDVARDADGLLQVTVLEGRRADLPPDTACIEIALLKAVTIELEEPIVAPAQ